MPKAKGKEVAAMLKAIHAQEDKREALRKAAIVIKKLQSMKLSRAADIVKEGIAETGNSALMLVAARLRHIAGTKWGLQQYLKMDRLGEEAEEIAA